ncbi:MAG TPA: MFS transporter [Rhabdochlamydiaceae bacterium]|nr:MFS transporter [Rhabdochlamydiaceae bacterium]
MKTKTRKSFFSLLFVIALDNLGFGLPFILFSPLMLDPKYGMLSESVPFETRTFLLGLLFGAFPITQLFGAPIFGDFADFYGRKKALYVTIFGTTFGYILSAIAVLIFNLPLLFFSRLITGFFAGNQSVCIAAIADLSPTEKERSRNFGFMTVALGLGWPLAMFAGGYLSDPSRSVYFNPSLPFALAIILSLINVLIVKKFFIETHEVRGKIRFDWLKGLYHIKQAFLLKGVRTLFVVMLCWVFGWVLPNQWLGAYSILKFNATQEMITWAMVVAGITWTLGGLLINPFLIKYFSTRTTAAIGFAFSIIFILLAYIPTNFTSFILLFGTAALTASFVYSNTLNLISIHAKENIQGAIMGLSASVMSFGFVIMSVFGGVLGESGMHQLLPISSAILALGLLLLFVPSKKKA